MDGQFEVAREQLDFLKEIQANGGTTGGGNVPNRSEILYMSALLSRLTNQPSDEVLGLLNEAVDTHFRCVKSYLN